MDLDLNNLTLSKEKTYYSIVLILSIIVWLFIILTVVGLFYVLLFSFVMWLTNGLFIAYLKSESVKVGENQLPALYKTHLEVCEKLKLTKIPDLFVIQSGGHLNAFATRHSRRKFIVIFSDALEALGQDTDEIRFLLGHEVGHIKRKHIVKQMLLFPGLILPLLGPAYHRACEATCDRFGSYATNNIDGAINTMMVLSGGKNSGRWMSADAFSNQYIMQRGFFVSWHELISGYPTLSQRVANLQAIKDGRPQPQSGRNPLAYLFALFSFGGSGAGSNFFITIAVIALLAAIAIPNLLRAKILTNDTMAQSTLQAMATAVDQYATANNGQYPLDMSQLTTGANPYLRENYCEQEVSGFQYQCRLWSNGYQLEAVPISEGRTGTQTFTLEGGGQ